jgi:hypothetical protein
MSQEFLKSNFYYNHCSRFLCAKERRKGHFQSLDAYNFTVDQLKKTLIGPKADLDNDIDGVIEVTEFDKGRKMPLNFSQVASTVRPLSVLCDTEGAALKTVFWA